MSDVVTIGNRLNLRVEWPHMGEIRRTQKALRDARVKRSWTLHRAAQHMAGVTDQQLRNLEGASGATRVTKPGRLRLDTAIEILRAYWPDIDLDDLMGERTLLKVTPSDHGAKRRLDRYAAAQFAADGGNGDRLDGGDPRGAG